MMNIKDKKKFVTNNQAYTLLEALMSLFIFTIVIFSLLNFLNVIETNTKNNYNFKEISLFFSQIQEDFLESKVVKIQNSQEIIFEDYVKNEIEYKYDKNRLIRQKNNKGYEIMLNKIESIEFYEKNNLIYVKVKFENIDEEYNWVINSE